MGFRDNMHSFFPPRLCPGACRLRRPRCPPPLCPNAATPMPFVPLPWMPFKSQLRSPGRPHGHGGYRRSAVAWPPRHNPNNPKWANRDRFVLSNGHGSMLLYSLLHLTGYDLSIDDLKNFRQLHSRTRVTRSTVTPQAWKPPLARWVRALPMPWAWLSPKRPWRLSNSTSRVFTTSSTTTPIVFMGDGCLMEGISHEVCSLAGTLQPGQTDRVL
jgi:transketolase